MSSIQSVSLPEFGGEDSRFSIPVELYRRRREKACSRMDRASFDYLVVYADREHFANMEYLTGFDPRFEEALLLLARDGQAKLLVGNECMGYLPAEADSEGVEAGPEAGGGDSRGRIDVELFQEFSLLGQPRGDSRELSVILREFGIGGGSRVGCVGWKYFGAEDFRDVLEIPSYIADTVRGIAGWVGNATSIFMDAADGLRIVNEPEQIAFFEYAATVTSEGVKALLGNLAVGAREDELERYLGSRGLPLSCHRMVGFGEKAKQGLASASDNAAKLGDAFTTALGVTGSLTSRAGFVAHSAADLALEVREFYPEFVANYFDVVAAWYESVRVGVSAGQVYEAVDAVRDDELFTFALNPGHSIHLDEWVHSAFSAGSKIALRSGMALQVDIIPVSQGPPCPSNAEDGVVLADEGLRHEVADRFPALWSRVEARRRFMADVLGIHLDESLLPLSNTAGWLPAFALDLSKAMVRG